MQSLDKDRIKNSLSIDNIKKILIDLGSDEPVYSKRDNALIAQTICHGGEKHKLYYYIDNQIFHCYTDCGDSFDIYELIIRTKRNKGIHLTFPQVVRYVANKSGIFLYENTEFTEDLQQYEKIDDWNWIKQFTSKKHEESKTEVKIYNEKILEMFCYKPHKEWLEDNISQEAMRKFEIGYWDKFHKITIPHRDICGNLIGVRGRALMKEDVQAGNKYMPLTVEKNLLTHQLGKNLYGIYQNKDTIIKTGKLFLVESEKSVLQIETMYPGFNYSLAVCGSNITDDQCEMIKELGVTKCYIAFDKEYEDYKSRIAKLYYLKLIRYAQKLNPYMTVYLVMDRQGLLHKKDSPSDKGKMIFEKLLDDKIEISESVFREERV